MISDKHLKEIIEKYWDSKYKKVADYDFQQEALMAQMILELRAMRKSTPKYGGGPG
jgi:hypothetical protein